MRNTIISSLGLAAALCLAPGCVDMSQCQKPSGCAPVPQFAQKPGDPPMLADGLVRENPAERRRFFDCAPPPPPPGREYGPDERVYDLGSGVVANSNAILMAGGRTKPVPAYRPGGALAGCPPPGGRTPTTPSSSRIRPPAAAPVATAPQVDGPVRSQPLPDSVTGCLPIPGAEAVCVPGTNMTECFTLTEEEARQGPPIIHPGQVSKYTATLGRRAPAQTAEGVTSLRAPADSLETSEPVISAAGATPAASPDVAPADTPAIPAAPGVEDRPAMPPVEALTREEPVATASPEAPQPEVAPTTIAPLAPPPEVVAAIAREPVPPAAESNPVAPPLPSETAVEPEAPDYPVAVRAEPLPPVPQVGDMAREAERMLANPPATVSTLPEVELPPKLLK